MNLDTSKISASSLRGYDVYKDGLLYARCRLVETDKVPYLMRLKVKDMGVEWDLELRA